MSSFRKMDPCMESFLGKLFQSKEPEEPTVDFDPEEDEDDLFDDSEDDFEDDSED